MQEKILEKQVDVVSLATEVLTKASKPMPLESILEGYRVCAKAENKSPKTIDKAIKDLSHFAEFLKDNNLPLDVREIGASDLRAYIRYLQEKDKYETHPFNHPQQKKLAPCTVNSYVRTIRAFWTWLCNEELIKDNPIEKVKPPKMPSKLVSDLTDAEVDALLSVINTSTAVGYRDYVIILTLLDCGLRAGELAGLKVDDIDFDDDSMRVFGKGSKERRVPFGARVAKELWKYKQLHRPEPETPACTNFFLTREARPVDKNRIEKRMSEYKEKAGITGKRCSPHSLRATCARRFMDCGGDPFTLQKILGHSRLDMTRQYFNQSDAHIKASYRKHSPVDNMKLPKVKKPKSKK